MQGAKRLMVSRRAMSLPWKKCPLSGITISGISCAAHHASGLAMSTTSSFSPWMMRVFCTSGAGGEIGNVAAEREACDGELGGLRVLGAGVVDDGDAVVGFAFALAVLPCAVACAAQVGQVAMKAHLREAFGGGLDDFVGEGAALGGVGVVNHGNAAFCALGGEVEGF